MKDESYWNPVIEKKLVGALAPSAANLRIAQQDLDTLTALYSKLIDIFLTIYFQVKLFSVNLMLQLAISSHITVYLVYIYKIIH